MVAQVQPDLIWVYPLCHSIFYGTTGINGFKSFECSCCYTGTIKAAVESAFSYLSKVSYFHFSGKCPNHFIRHLVDFMITQLLLSSLWSLNSQ